MLHGRRSEGGTFLKRGAGRARLPGRPARRPHRRCLKAPKKDKVLIANGQDSGDSIPGPVRLIEEGPLGSTLDYLAEVTMSIMQKLKGRDPSKGYATDFVALLDRILPKAVEKSVKIVANAGGVNPHACKDAVLEVIKKHGLEGVKVAVVEGDDILGDLDGLMASGERFENMDTGEALETVRERVSSANVYLGAFPIAEALHQGAQIVITGRHRPGLVIACHPRVRRPRGLHQLAQARRRPHRRVAPSTGGNYTDWETISDMATTATRSSGLAHGTGDRTRARGRVTATRSSTSSPTRWATRELHHPDVVADFTSFSITDEGNDRVRIEGVKGHPATPTYKVCMSYQDGVEVRRPAHDLGPTRSPRRSSPATSSGALAYDGFEYPRTRSHRVRGQRVPRRRLVPGADDPRRSSCASAQGP